ncbi:glycosyltransferase family 4 protein [Planobispora rosea]|uniref:glycosyltransferase family 4 protein n=1 Tax=Planobispora rosea TaxID=35762 RepID=UPI00083B2EE3|nr:glycosyltransferase family 4 protein [Planobispora rosea]
MRVLALVHGYPPARNAGAEWALHTLLRSLVARGHRVDVHLAGAQMPAEPYAVDGVQVHPIADAAGLLTDGDPVQVIVTHLRSTPRAMLLGELYRVPVIQVLHNDNAPERRWMTRRPALVVYNSEWVRRSCLDWWSGTQHDEAPAGIVVRPPVLAEDYATVPGDRVTLINLCANKGAATFWALAKRMPEVEFLAVEGGYGDQIVYDLPNVEVISHIPGHQMREQVYARTRILLAPSRYESWGRVAVEAMCSGIPVIAHPTPGLIESLGEAGVFVDREDLDGWEAQIRRLHSAEAWAQARAWALGRASELDPAADLHRWTSAVESLAGER